MRAGKKKQHLGVANPLQASAQNFSESPSLGTPCSGSFCWRFAKAIAELLNTATHIVNRLLGAGVKRM